MLVSLCAILLMAVGDGRYGRIADLRCKCEIEKGERRKRTLRVSAGFFCCANAANGDSEPTMTDAATYTNGRSGKSATRHPPALDVIWAGPSALEVALFCPLNKRT
jgi:hypothetical protein